MSNDETTEYKPGNKLAFGLSSTGDQIVYFSFTLLIFVFYFSVVGIDVNLVTIAFVIWSVWNAINDPLLGLVSDRTRTKWGKRKPYIAAGFIPLSLMMIFLYTAPVGDPFLSFLYLLLVIILFDFLFTMVSLNLTALFPEMWFDKEERNSANNYRQMFTVIGLIIAFLVPTAIISDLESPAALPEYHLAGMVLAVLALITYFIALRWGARERPELVDESKSTLNWGDSFKHTLGNRTFQVFLICNTCNWYVFGLIPTIIPLFGEHVIGVEDELLVGIMMAAAFISGGIFVNFWKMLVNRGLDLRKAWMSSMAVWIVALLALFIVTDPIIAMIVFFLNGIGLAGSLQLRDLMIADIIDEDEVKTGYRREGAFFGVNALIMRLSTIFVFVSIALVFNNIGWKVYVPDTTPEIIFGLQVLMAIFPAIALLIGILVISRYGLIGDRLLEVKKKCEEIHRGKVPESPESRSESTEENY